MFKVTQWFAENPQFYEQFNLPGHDGLDLVAPHGQAIFTVADGAVYRVELNPNASNYGIHVRIAHSDGFKTIYAHLDRANVNVDNNVYGGEQIGDADNTGNSSGSHLHLGEKEDGVTYVDENGNSWPYNFRDPWLHLRHIYNEWLEENGQVGWLYTPGLINNLQNTHARVYGTLNFREAPGSSHRLLGQVTSHTVVRLTGEVENGYHRVISPIDIPSTTPPPPSANSRFGLHFRADPDDRVSDAEYNEQLILMNAGGDTAKLLHNHPASVFHAVCSMQPQTLVVRAFVAWGGRNVTANQFFDWTKDELLNRIDIVRQYGIEPIIEVHNEPNLVAEGLTLSWADGTQFGYWLADVLDLYRSVNGLHNVKYMYPGLSPGSTIGGVRQDSTSFLDQSLATGVFTQLETAACHAYWSQGWPMQTAINHVNHTKNRTGKPVYVTEASINDRPSVLPPSEYGKQYADFRNAISVEGIYFFVGSASDPTFEPETWVTEAGAAKGIAQAMVNNL